MYSTKHSLLSNNKNILIVEDDPINYMLLKEILTLNNYNVTIAQNGKEAVKIIKSDKNKFFLILMDIKMPIMNGFEACSIIKKIKNIPIIAQTADILTNTTEKFEKYNFDKVIYKPFSIDHIIKIVEFYFLENKKFKNLHLQLN
ncbi:MAG: response regulator [Bacteroidales bacterium]|nr:response regulator [Bacteroidales bacterium]MBN2756383.1 response regulator [Bacteroidales bacterium]